jgi:ribosome-associated translation inhibitor RaiA
MPEGVVQWFDPGAGEGRIAKGGRLYSVVGSDMEPETRAAGSRVHFDIDRKRPGVAGNVTALRGGRSDRHHRGRGATTGARRPDAKGKPTVRPSVDQLIHAENHPANVARRWAALTGEGDVGRTLELYAPDAVVHTPDAELTTRTEVLALLAAPMAAVAEPTVRVHGFDGLFRVLRQSADGADEESWLRVEHGQIVEQWWNARPPSVTEAEAEWPFPLPVVTRGEVADEVKGYAADKIAALSEEVGKPVLFGQVKLTQHADPAAAAPAVAEAMLDVNGQVVRARVSAGVMTEAIDLLVARMQRQLRRFGWSRPVDVQPEPGEWRHGNLPSHADMAWFQRSPEEREIIRAKTVMDEPQTIDEAAFDMELLDHSFYLFNELSSGHDALLFRRSSGELELTTTEPETTGTPESAVDVVISGIAPPILSVAEAVEWIETTDQRFLFFVDSDSERGTVLYHRYDGHYGLITPAAPPPTG